MSLRAIERFVEIGSTIGATTTVLKAWAVPDGAAVRVRAEIVGRDTGNGEVVGLSKAGTFKRVGGTLALVGSLLDVATPVLDTGLSLASATVAVNGSSVELRATGVAGRTVEWMGDLTIWVN